MSAFLYIQPLIHDGITPAQWAQQTLAGLRCSAVRVLVQADNSVCCLLDEELNWRQTTALAAELLARLGDNAFGAAGLASSNFVAACAARLVAAGTLHIITPGQEVVALAGLPVSWLPAIATTAVRDLHVLRVFTLGDLAAVPPAVLSKVFGPQARQWQALARGELASVLGAQPRLTVPTIRVELAPEGRAIAPTDIAPLADELAAALQLAERAAANLLVTIGFADNSQSERLVKPPQSLSAAPSILAATWPAVTALLRARRRRPAWVALAASRTTEALVQLALPLPPAPAHREQLLYATLNLLQERFGPQVIGFGRRQRDAA